jgi:hypothetical protein
MDKTALYIEKREQGDYAVRIPGSEIASAIRATKEEAISRARQMYSDADIYVERAHETGVGGIDRWQLIGA